MVNDGFMMLMLLLVPVPVMMLVDGVIMLFLVIVFLMMLGVGLFFILGVSFRNFHCPMFAMLVIFHWLVMVYRFEILLFSV